HFLRLRPRGDELGLTAAKGYGSGHQRTRRDYARLVATGKVDCARCGGPIDPGEPWDLGHVDGDRRRYQGPEHRACNRATSSRRPGVSRRRLGVKPVVASLPPVIAERAGLGAKDRRWNRVWLRELRRPPADATWP